MRELFKIGSFSGGILLIWLMLRGKFRCFLLVKIGRFWGEVLKIWWINRGGCGVLLVIVVVKKILGLSWVG